MQDRYGHRISYLRVSITDRCNERCSYCMPQELQEWLPRHEILTYEETLRLIRIAAELGVSKVRITGGEPLTRRGILDFVRQIPEIPRITSIGLSTNGTLLAREITPAKTMAEALRDAGVQSVNISLDTLDAAVYLQITGRDFHARVLDGVDAAIAAGSGHGRGGARRADGERAGDQVGAAAGGERHQDMNGLTRKFGGAGDRSRGDSRGRRTGRRGGGHRDRGGGIRSRAGGVSRGELLRYADRAVIVRGDQ